MAGSSSPGDPGGQGERRARPGPRHGAPPRHGRGWPGRSARLTPRGRAVTAAAVVVLVIAVAGVTLRASQDRSPGRPASSAGPAAATAPPASPGSPPSPGPAATPPGTAAPGAGRTVSIDWVGDMTFGTPGSVPAAGAGSLLAGMAPSLHSDLTIGNLETVLGDLPMSKCAPGESDCYQFETPAATARVLKNDGFGAVNVANNHTLDAGQAGVTSTDAALRAAGLAYAGRPGQISYLSRNGITIALLGFAPWPYDADALDIPAARALVRQAARHARVVIVMEHIGAEGDSAQHVRPAEESFLGQDRGNPVAFAHAVIDAGADLVVGSGPHVLRGFQWYRGRLIAYSLGNFTGYHTFGLDPLTSQSAVLHVTLGAGGQFVSGSITAARLVSPGIPRPDPAGAAVATIRRLSESDFGGSAARLTAAGIIEPPAG